MNLRDHDQPCEHEEAELWKDHAGKGRDWWACGYHEADAYGEVLYDCPGGAKVEGERIWWCEISAAAEAPALCHTTNYNTGELIRPLEGHEKCGWRLLVREDT